ncbi:hypothetical protein SDRG_12240 [Saprolegnia diclina VS20]|uniref:MATE family multidrug resistance protein n=1 Tax=Saprolegnia diclina (strain VS20) TaxID=1156394 RepID=T0RCP0_SAPDV|nr:hypothetical protein SDRG_12240 [Saprolegnia diclina VS20]EQC29958.1 hypothetical protein SDRG_12240 [Saprolegnia diclina VS20]|eukprot:XP_008616525.1 hypothetical protein SDRG_12240 [Saprolegnia diclina VS20]
MSKVAKEADPLLVKKADTDVFDARKEFITLASMAVQVSLASVARIALVSIDSAFLGHLGTQALAASSLASIWTAVPLFTVWSIASSLVTLCGQAWGAKNSQLVGIWLQFAVIVVTVLMVPVFIWYWCLGYIMQFATSDPEIIELGTRFARILAFSIWPSLLYACMRQYFQAMGIVFPITIVGCVSIVLTIAANYVLIYGYAGWGGLGFDGSPLATVLASWFQPISLYLYCFVYKKYHLQAWGGWRFEELTRDRLVIFMRMATPLALNNLLVNMAQSCMSLIAAKLGSESIAANAVMSTLWSLVWALFWGFGCATQARVANHLGAGHPISAQKISLMGFTCTLLTGVVLAASVFLLRNEIFRLYTSDSELLGMCILVLPLFLLGFTLESLEMSIQAMLNGMGQTHIATYVSFFASWFVQLPVCYLLAIALDWGFVGIWYGTCITEIFKLTIFGIKYLGIDWNDMALQALQSMEVKEDDDSTEELNAMDFNLPVGYVLSSPASAVLSSSATPRRRRGSTHSYHDVNEA